MPDLTCQIFYHCISAERWSMKIKDYLVEYSDSNKFYQFDYKCACKSFLCKRGVDRNGHCKHIKEARKSHCNWQQFIDGGEPIKSYTGLTCPKCGSGVISRFHGV